MDANRAFHRHIHQAAGNRDAILILERHWLFIRALWRRYGPRPERFQGVIADHRQMLAAFAARDTEGAAAITAAHTAKAKQRLLEAMHAHFASEGHPDD
ncbi:hypothetical protein DDT56_00710 [Brenneria corticis]|uniref:GntR C-terminal domain-containing protein n=1 Tax=Brenneria corticis TaxID=2173106 RepID=A0A2U1UCY5_9GAMM|nr:hypothetical protein DDT56_00710 [Brenneria sp. CFCC 11842]